MNELIPIGVMFAVLGGITCWLRDEKRFKRKQIIDSCIAECPEEVIDMTETQKTELINSIQESLQEQEKWDLIKKHRRWSDSEIEREKEKVQLKRLLQKELSEWKCESKDRLTVKKAVARLRWLEKQLESEKLKTSPKCSFNDWELDSLFVDFLLNPKVSIATKKDYEEWLEGYIQKNPEVNLTYVNRQFDSSNTWCKVDSNDVYIPPAYGAKYFNVICNTSVPSQIGDWGDNQIFFMSDFSTNARETEIYCYSDMGDEK